MAKAEQAGGGGGIVEARKERNREMELYLASNPEYMGVYKSTFTFYRPTSYHLSFCIKNGSQRHPPASPPPIPY